MKQFFVALIALFTFIQYTEAQSSTDYFQQEVDYTIDVSLNDSLHLLDGTTDINYTNHSEGTLNEIFLHLWANAYKSKRSAFAQQKLNEGNRAFYFAKPNELGGYKEIDIRINNKVVEWNYWEGHEDVVKIVLSKPLAAGESLVINTKFLMKVPASFSRLGRVKNSYQMTQWYPKPAVFDREGWHPMPYLDQGEFYSEFGKFDVSITLPSNYVVGATGRLETESEKAFLAERIEASKQKRPEGWEPDTTNLHAKTIRYTAENVHDFAWFADPYFYVEGGQKILSSGDTIATYAMYTDVDYDLWHNKAISYVGDAVKFYSDKVGNYPYPHVTAVQSALSAGAGMEYPMITVIGRASSDESLDEVITHEVGHNWFYGILASNERDHAWLDEGFNSYYEARYMSDKYGESGYELFGKLDDKLTGGRSLELLASEVSHCRHSHQITDTPSGELTSTNYALESYARTSKLLKHLEGQLGKEKLDEAMKSYYETWKFKHPRPQDTKQALASHSGEDLTWLFDDLIQSKRRVDYAIEGIQETSSGTYELDIKNKSGVAAPLQINVLDTKGKVSTVYKDGFKGTQKVEVTASDAQKFIIKNDYLVETDISDNSITIDGKRGRKFKPTFLMGASSHETNRLFWSPVLAGNKYDGFMAGLAVYNSIIIPKQLEWSIAPMYAFGSKDVTGFADLTYRHYPNKIFKEITFGVDLRRFSYATNDFYKKFDNTRTNFTYNRIRTAVDFHLPNSRQNSAKKQYFTLELLSINSQKTGTIGRDTVATTPEVVVEQTYTGHRAVWDFVPRLKYHISNKKTLYPYELNAGLEQYTFERGGSYTKLEVEAKTKVYYEENKAFHFRLFAGTFLSNSKKDIISRTLGSYTLNGAGISDYWADNLYLGRNEREGFFSRQIYETQGGFKNALLSGNSAGVSNKGIIALNMKVDIPIKMNRALPQIRPYADLAYLPSNNNDKASDGLYAQAGLALEYGDYFGLYIPLASTKNIVDNSEKGGNIFSKMTFKFNFNLLNPRGITRNIEF